MKKRLIDELIENKYEDLPYHIKDDIVNKRCPSDVVMKLLDLNHKTHLLWGKKEGADWVSRSYKRAKKSCVPKEMCENINKYLGTRRFTDLENNWYGFLHCRHYKNGYIYILHRLDKQDFKKIGMIGFLRNVEDRLREIEYKYGYWFDILYWRYTINIKEAENLAHEMLPNRVNPKREFFYVPDKKAVTIVNRAIDITERNTIKQFEQYLSYNK